MWSVKAAPGNFQGARLVRCVFLVLMTCVGMCAAGITNVQCPTSGTLADLIALNSDPTPGCTIDGLNYSAFSWTQSPGSTTSLAASQVSFTTSITPGMLGTLDWTSSGFSVSGSNTLIYTLSYEIDPPPIIIRAFDQEMFTDPPVAPWFADIPTTICLGAAFAGGVCSTSTVSVDTFDNGTSMGNQLTDSVTFLPQSTIGISTVIDLEANGASSSISGFENTTEIIPEPASYFLVAVGLTALVWLRSKRARLLSISARKSD
jgi:hypothetical protein